LGQLECTKKDWILDRVPSPFLAIAVYAAIPNSELKCKCDIGLPSPQPSPKFGRGSKKLRFFFRLPFSHSWEKGLGDEGKPSKTISMDFEFGIAAECGSEI
jgi:hypothetical protein